MGRKIPSSKKHKKTKSVDPFYTGERKKLLEKCIGITNRPPANADIQEIPRKLVELMNLKKQAKTRKLKVSVSTYKKHKKQKLMKLEIDNDDFGSMQPGMNNPLKPVPEMKRRPGESDIMFVQRVSRIARGIIEKSKLEEKLDVDIVEQPSGTVEIQKRTKLEFDEDGKLEDDKRNKLKKTSNKKEKRRIKEKEKKEKKKEDHLLDEFETPKDFVRFGEVASEPPNLQFKKTRNKESTKSLILEKMFKTNTNGNSENQATQSKKRKLVDSIEKLKLEKERQFVISEYRKLKKTKKQ